LTYNTRFLARSVLGDEILHICFTINRTLRHRPRSRHSSKVLIPLGWFWQYLDCYWSKRNICIDYFGLFVVCAFWWFGTYASVDQVYNRYHSEYWDVYTRDWHYKPSHSDQAMLNTKIWLHYIHAWTYTEHGYGDWRNQSPALYTLPIIPSWAPLAGQSDTHVQNIHATTYNLHMMW